MRGGQRARRVEVPRHRAWRDDPARAHHRAGTTSIDTDDVLLGVGFLFDRATALGQPVVVNLSLGSDFGPHDGTMAWEQTLASYVGPDHPGRALVVAAGNSGSISPADGPLVHQNVYVSTGATMRVPIPTVASQAGGVQVWVAMHSGADLRVGLDGPDGTWIDPVAAASSAGKQTGGYQAGIYNGSQSPTSPVPAQSHGAVVDWQGAWPGGTYAITLSGHGTADLYVEGIGDASSPGGQPLGFADGVRESTINLPATVPSIIGVGCTINKTSWTDLEGRAHSIRVPLLDPAGGAPEGLERAPVDGEPCWFSSAGPTLTGFAKPDIMAPGAAIVGALSQQAVPPSATSIFSDSQCGTPSCEVIDPLHGVSAGTSFSSPIVAGAVAVLLQHDPTLSEDTILAALQGGAHPLRGAAPWSDQGGPGELDVLGAVAAVDRLRDPALALPVLRESWLTLGAEEYLADGSTPLEGVLELRASPAAAAPPRLDDASSPDAVAAVPLLDDASSPDAATPADLSAPPADGFAQGRLAAYALVDGQPFEGAAQLARRGPGVWIVTVQLPAGLGPSLLTVGATFDGAPIVEEKTVPIATDVWTAEYPVSVRGGCAIPRGARQPREGIRVAMQARAPSLGPAAAGRARAATRARSPSSPPACGDADGPDRRARLRLRLKASRYSLGQKRAVGSRLGAEVRPAHGLGQKPRSPALQSPSRVRPTALSMSRRARALRPWAKLLSSSLATFSCAAWRSENALWRRPLRSGASTAGWSSRFLPSSMDADLIFPIAPSTSAMALLSSHLTSASPPRFCRFARASRRSDSA